MNILFYGAGVIGSIYASKLVSAGHNVSVLARNRRHIQLEAGIKFHDSVSGRETISKVRVISELDQDSEYELIIVAVRSEQIDAIIPVLKKNKSKRILLMVNTPSGYGKWIQHLGADRLFVGFPAAGGYLDDCGGVHGFIMTGVHQLMQKTVVGNVELGNKKGAEDIVRLFRSSGFPTGYCANMDAWQKTHVAMLAPLVNALHKHKGDLKLLADSKRDIVLYIEAVREGFRVLSTLGYPVIPFTLGLFFSLPMFTLVLAWQHILKSKFSEVSINPNANNAWGEFKKIGDEFQVLVTNSGISAPSINELRLGISSEISYCANK